MQAFGFFAIPKQGKIMAETKVRGILLALSNTICLNCGMSKSFCATSFFIVFDFQ